MIRIILIVVFLIAIIITISLLVVSSKKNKRNKPLPFVVALLLLVACLFIIPGSFHQVDTGTVAVVRHLGKITKMRQPGTYFDFYFTNSYETYDAKVQQDKITTSAYSKDGQTMDLEVFLQYQVQVDNIVKIATEYGSLDALQARIETVTIEKTKSVMSSAEAMTIVQNRSKFSNDVSTAVREGISDDYYVYVKDVVLTNIDFTTEFEKSVEDKVIAEQEKQASITRAEAELEVAKLEAQKKIAEAEGNAEAQKILAEGLAEATSSKIIEVARTVGYDIETTYVYTITTEVSKLNGEYSITKEEVEKNVLEAETTNVVVADDGGVTVTTKTTKSLSKTRNEIQVNTGPGSDKFKELVENYLQYLSYLDKWDGKLPEVVSGDDAISIIVPNN